MIRQHVTYEGTVYKKVSLDGVLKIGSNENIPLFVYLHGLGSGVHEGLGIAKNIGIDQEDIAYAIPECPVGEAWDPMAVGHFVQKTLRDNPKIDPHTVYLGGFSMGARGTWDTAFEYPHMFSAIIPMAGFSCYINAPKIRELKCRIFHGDCDDVVPYEESYKMYKALDQIGSDVKLYTLKGFGHGGYCEEVIKRFLPLLIEEDK